MRIAAPTPAFRTLQLASMLLALGAVILCVARYVWSSRPYPPGLDGAQWLVYGRQLLGGPARSSESAYPPLVPFLTHVAAIAVGPVDAVRLIAILTMLLLAIAIWRLSITLAGIVAGSLATMMVVPATAIAEPFYYGGYPQQAALGFGLLGLASLAAAGNGTSDKRRKRLVFAGVWFTLASLSHVLYGPLLLASGAVLILLMLWTQPARGDRFPPLLECLLPGAAVSGILAAQFLQRGYSAPLAATERARSEAWVYATREAPFLWAILVVLGLVFAVKWLDPLRRTARSNQAGVQLKFNICPALALLAPALALFLLAGQPRLIPPVLIGGVLLFAIGARSATKAAPRFAAALMLISLAISSWLAATSTSFTREFAGFYHVLDESMVAAIAAIPHGDSGEVAVAADAQGWPVGWWFEALQDRPVYVGSNVEWLAFPPERDRAEAVAMLLSRPGASEMRQSASELGVAYIAIQKWQWIGWDRWLDGSVDTPDVVYDDNQTLVLAVSRSSR